MNPRPPASAADYQAAIKFRDACLLAAAHGLQVVEDRAAPGGVDYVVYRKLDTGRRIRLGRRATPAALCSFVKRLTALEVANEKH